MREDLYEAVARGARELLRADACQIHRLDVEADELILVSSDPADAPAPSPRPGGAGLVLDLMRRASGHGPRRPAAAPIAQRWPDVGRQALLVAPLVARNEQLGVICCLAHNRQFTDEDAELLGAVANQTAVGLKKAELIERLTAENIVKDMFDALAAGSIEAGRGEGERGPMRPLGPPPLPARRARPASATAPRRLARAGESVRGAAAARCTRGRSSTPVTTGCGRWRRCRARTAGRPRQLREACESLAREEGLIIGLSDVDRGAVSARRRMREAADAARIGRSLVAERRRGLLRAARRLPVPRPPGARRRARAIAIARRSRSWPTTTAAAAPA